MNIRGTNGSGKSTIPMSMMEDKKLRVEPIYENGGKKEVVTVFPTYEWVALGSYWTKTGGMDTFKNTQVVKDALEYAWLNYPGYDILMEGIMCSTVYSTYHKLFQEYYDRIDMGKVSPREILIVNFVPPIEVCIDRVLQRNGGKEFNEEGLRSKWNTVVRNADKFKTDGYKCVKIDNSKTKKERMLVKFLDLCDRHR